MNILENNISTVNLLKFSSLVSKYRCSPAPRERECLFSLECEEETEIIQTVTNDDPKSLQLSSGGDQNSRICEEELSWKTDGRSQNESQLKILQSETKENVDFESISRPPSKVIDFFTNDITTRFIENITGNYSFLQEDSFKKYLENCPKRFSTKINFSENEFYYLNVVRSLNTSRDDLKHINYSMFKTQCFLNHVKYTCERIFTNNKNGLCFQKEMNSPSLHSGEFLIDYRSSNVRRFSNSENLQTATNENHIRFNGLEIEAEDPRLFIYKNKVHVVFICLSPYENQERCVAITEFEEWNPIFLQV